MGQKTGFARAGDAKGSLVMVRVDSLSPIVTVLPWGAGDAHLDADRVSEADLRDLERKWRVLWFDEPLASTVDSIFSVLDDENISPKRRQRAASPVIHEKFSEVLSSQIRRRGAWLISPNAGGLLRALNVITANRGDREVRVRRKEMDAMHRVMGPLLEAMSEEGLVLVLAKRELIPRDLWE